jgi:two-component system chemotaxis response regulator CheB
VVVVEDSLVQRANLVAVLEAEGDIVVVGEATTAPEATAMVAALRPDVVTLDLNIPGGGGQPALERIMAETPTPILVLSSTVHDGRSIPAVEALVGGALLAVPKPARWTPEFESSLRRDVRMIRKVPVIRHLRASSLGRPATPPSTAAAAPPRRVGAASATVAPAPTTCLVAMAASTGGPAALATVLGGLAGLQAPVLVVQHIHPDFVQGLVDWMRKVSPLPVELAHHGQVLRCGHIYIGPGGTHLRVGRDRRVELVDAPRTIHIPSADQLFESVAARAGSHSVGVLLTGMGEDGAAGLAAMHRSGAHTIVQDEATSAVYGMPRAAVRLGAADRQLPLPGVAAAVMTAVRAKRSVST